jgi:hypothetical protein
MNGFIIRCVVAAFTLGLTIYTFASGHWGWGIVMIFVLALVIATFFIHERLIMAMNQMRKGDTDKAAYHINKITHPHLMPKRQHAYILFLQASMNAQSGGLTKSEPAIRKAMDLGLKDVNARAQAHFQLAAVCAQTGRVAESKTHIAEAKKLDKSGMLKDHIKMMESQMNAMPSKNQMRMAQMNGMRQKPSKGKR